MRPPALFLIRAAVAAAAVLPGSAGAATAPVPGTAVLFYEDTLLTPPADGPETTLGAIVQTQRGGTRALAAPDNSSPTNLHSPAWRPDGRRIAFVAGANVIVTQDARGANRREIQTEMNTVGGISWSPDGHRIGFAGSRISDADPNNPYGRNSDLFVVGADGSGLRRLTTHEEVVNAGWSPRGGLAYRRWASGGRCDNRGCTDPAAARFDGLWVIDPDRRGARAKRIVRGVGTFNGWSPDGQRLLWHKYAFRPDARNVVQVRDSRGKLLRTLRFGNDSVTWTSDGRVAYLAPTLLGSWRIVARRPDGSQTSVRALPDPALDARRYIGVQLQAATRR